jgi:quercetin dioxygenase-like cupin family protein
MLRYRLAHLPSLTPIECSCGVARRAFADAPDAPASVHLVEVRRDSRTHFHLRQTETYYVLRGEGTVELDGQAHPARPGDAFQILPGCRHRAVGDLTLLNIVVPPFDPTDEHFDEPGA